MEFDKEKWDVYVQEQGGVEAVAKKAMENKTIQYCYDIEVVIRLLESNFATFNPFKQYTHSGIFLALNLNADDFILPEPIHTVTGIEALRALCDGKVLRDIETDALYKIENNIYLLQHEKNVWGKAYIDFNFLLSDKFEVIDAENDFGGM